MKRPTITGDMIIAEVIEKHPEVVDVLFNHGIQCFGCSASTTETLEQGYLGHYGEDADLETFLKELNDSITVEPCYQCQKVSSYDGPMLQVMDQGAEKWVCMKCAADMMK